MSVYYDEVYIKTKGEVDIIDITKDVQSIVSKSKIKNGIACVFIPGSTGCITTIEYEPGLKKDLPKILQRIAPKGEHYEHHETWHDDNGHSHVRAALLGPSLSVPVVEGQMMLGTWQQIILVDFDTRARTRTVICQIIGE